MRVGYGFNRVQADFADADVERVYIDLKGSGRMERTALLEAGLRSGDTLVLLSKRDLGVGGELPMLRTYLRERNIAVEVIERETEAPKAPPGHKPAFDLAPEDDERLRRLWTTPGYEASYVQKTGCEIIGLPFNKANRTKMRNFFNHRYGPRVKKKRIK